MTCIHCESGKKYTFTKGCRKCFVRWINGMPKNLAETWLENYGKWKGSAEMQQLKKECQEAMDRHDELNREAA